MSVFKKPDGSFVEVDEKFAPAAQAKGYVRSSLQQVRASKETGQAALEGAARGATLGFGDEIVADIENAFGPAQTGGVAGLEKQRAQTIEEMRLRKQENPYAAGAGELGGAVAMSVATGGGPSALVGGGLRGTLLEGGLMGLGAVVSESTLDKSPLTMEKMAAGMAGGALAAGGIHGALKGAGSLMSAGVKKLGGRTLADTFRGAADDAEWNAMFKGSTAAKNEPFKGAILKYGRDNGIIGHVGAALDEKTAKAAANAARAESTKIAGQMDDLERFVPLTGNDKLRFKFVDTIDKALDADYGGNPVFNDAVRQAKNLTSEMVGNRKLNWQKAWEIQSSLFKDLAGIESPPATKQVRETVRQAMRDFVFDEVGAHPNVAPGFGAAMRKTGQDARAAMALSKAIARRAAQMEPDFGNTALGGLISLGTGGPGAFVGGLAADAMKNQIRKRGGLVLGSVLRKLGDSGALNSIANGLQGRIGQVLQMAPNMLGGARMSIEAAFGRGAMDLLEEHVRIASGPDGPQYLASIGMTNETPEEVENVGHKLAAMDALHEAQADLDKRIDLGIDGVLGVKKGPALRYKSPDVSDFQTRYDRMKQTVQDPESAFANAPVDLMNGAPGTTAALTAKLLQANQFLLSKAPKDPYAGMTPALKPLWKPAASDVSKWYRYVEAVEQPARMLEKMAQGTFTLEHKEALQTVYPALYEDMKARMYDRLAQWEKPLPYGKKVMLSQFFGTQVLGLKPGTFNILQQSFQPKPEDAPPSKGGSRPDGREVIDADKNQLTQAQRIEAK